MHTKSTCTCRYSRLMMSNGDILPCHLIIPHYKNVSMQYVEIFETFSAIKIENFSRIFFIFLKTYIEGTRVPTIYVLEQK